MSDPEADVVHSWWLLSRGKALLFARAIAKYFAPLRNALLRLAYSDTSALHPHLLICLNVLIRLNMLYVTRSTKQFLE